MRKNATPARDEEREERIAMEIVVDAYNSEEQAIGWHCYLGDHLAFPFIARCIAETMLSPLKKGEEVEVQDMAPSENCMNEMFVIVKAMGRSFGVPLAQLEAPGTDKDTREAIADWHYWMGQGYRF